MNSDRDMDPRRDIVAVVAENWDNMSLVSRDQVGQQILRLTPVQAATWTKEAYRMPFVDLPFVFSARLLLAATARGFKVGQYCQQRGDEYIFSQSFRAYEDE